MHKFKNIKKNLIFTWGFSYVVIIAIMLIIILIISLIYNSTTKDISNSFNEYVFDTVTDSAESTLMSMNRLYTDISQNTNIISILTAEDIYSHQPTYNFISDLTSYKKFSPCIDMVFLYLKDSDTIISTNGITPSNLFHYIYFNSAKISYEEWKESLINHTESLLYSTMPCKNEGGFDINTVSMIFNLSDTASNCVGVILSNQDYFIKGLEKIEWEDLCDVYIYNRSGNLTAYRTHAADSFIPKTLNQVSNHNTKGLVFTSDITINGHPWKVVTVTPNTFAHQKLMIIWLTISTIILFLLVILYFIIKRNLSRNYRPIKTMLSFFNITETTNEYENLFSSIKSTLSKNTNLEKELRRHSEAVRKINLARLLRGDISYSPFDVSDFDFTGDLFAVLLFHLDDIDTLFQDTEILSPSAKLLDLSFIIQNVLSELMQEKNTSVYTTEINGQVVCLVNFMSDVKSKDIYAIAESCREFINKNFKIKLSFSFSKICEGVLNIPVAYDQAVHVFKYQRMLGIKEPMQFIDNSSHPAKANEVFDLHRQQALITAIKTGNRETALNVLKQIFSELEAQQNLPSDYFIYICLDIASTVTKSAGVIDVNDSLEFYRKIKECENLVSLYTQMTQCVTKILDETADTIQENKGRMHFLVSHIEKYVVDNYADINLNVNSIAGYFNMSPDYISLIFKKGTGKSLLSFINNLRIENAIKLINEGRYTKKEISKMVGFTSERSFYRILKQYEDNIKHSN